MRVCEGPKSKTPIETAVVRCRGHLPSLRAAWDRLASHEARDGLFRGYAWNVLWLRHVAPHATPHIVTVADDGGIVGLASLCETPRAVRFPRLRALGFAGRDVVSGDFLDILAEPGHEDLVREAVFAHLAEDLDRVPLVVLGDCLMDSATACRAPGFFAARGWRTRWQEERACPTIELPPDLDAYLKTLSRNTRDNLRRRPRQLREAGSEVRRLRGAAEVLPHLDVLFRLHEARWRALGQTGNFVRPGFRAFLRAFIEESPPDVSTELYLLVDGAGPFAAFLFFRRGDAVHFYQGGWDPGSPRARLSPGLTLLGRAIADAIDDGFRHFEFLRGDEAYKRKLTTNARRTATLVVAGRGLLPRAYLAALRLRGYVKKRRAARAW